MKESRNPKSRVLICWLNIVKEFISLNIICLFIMYMSAYMPAYQNRASDITIDGCKPSCSCWELKSGPLEEQSALNHWAISPAQELGILKSESRNISNKVKNQQRIYSTFKIEIWSACKIKCIRIFLASRAM